MFFALDLVRPGVRWSFKPTSAVLNFTAAVLDGQVLFQDMGGSVYCLALSDGSVTWQAPNERPNRVNTATAVAVGFQDLVHATSNAEDKEKNVVSGTVAAYSISNGARKWASTFNLEVKSSPSVLRSSHSCGCIVVVGLGSGLGGRVVALDAAEGRQLWTFQPPDALPQNFAIPNVALPWTNPVGSGDGNIYIGWLGCVVYALDSETGDELSSFQTMEENTAPPFGSPALGSDGLLVVPCMSMVLSFAMVPRRRGGTLLDQTRAAEACAAAVAPDALVEQRHPWSCKPGHARIPNVSLFKGPRPSSIREPTWTFPLPHPEDNDHFYASPIIDARGNTYIRASRDSLLYVLGPDGSVRGTFDVGMGTAIPALCGSSLFCADTMGFVTCLDIETGSVNWCTRPIRSPNNFSWAVAAHDETVVLVGQAQGGTRSKVHALETSDGSLRWAVEVPRVQMPDLPFFEDMVLVCDTAGAVVAIGLPDGVLRWSLSGVSGLAAGLVEGPPNYCSAGGVAVASDGLAVASMNVGTLGSLCAFDARTGKEKWRVVGEHLATKPVIYSLPEARYSEDTPHHRRFVVVGAGMDALTPFSFAPDTLGWWAPAPDTVVAVCADTGERLWLFEPPPWCGDFPTPPPPPTDYGWTSGSCPSNTFLHAGWGTPAVDADAVIFLGRQSGWFYALDGATGAVLASSRPGPQAGSPALAPGRVVIATPYAVCAYADGDLCSGSAGAEARPEGVAGGPTQNAPVAPEAPRWVVVGGRGTGGVLVRVAADTKSAELGRLGFGAVVRQRALEDGRLQFAKLTGHGPDSGWASLKVKGTPLLLEPWATPELWKAWLGRQPA